MSLPLSDIRILDLTRLLPGPFCSQILADFGAEVIKVEDTGMGDYIRLAPPFHEGEEAKAEGTASALFLSLNRNKQSIRLDLKSDDGRNAFLRLVESADVVLEGFRPGVMDRLGVGYETLRQINPGVVFCSISGYGQDGPNRDRAGHDLNYLAATGLLDMTGPADGPPVQSATQIGDIGGGAMSAAIGIMAALMEKGRSGRGQMVDISMTDGVLSWLALASARYFADGTSPERGDIELGGSLACYLNYEAADGYVSCGALEPKFWKAFCEGAGRPDLIEHQFDRPGSEGHGKVAEVFLSRTRQDWKEFNDEHNCCIEPILSLGEALESELFEERGMVAEFDQPGIGPVRQIGNPIRLSGTPAREPGPAPAFGGDTDRILREAGFSEEEVRELFESGAAAGPDGETGGMEFRA
jgi:crotonobetainyl-CoA:carnitine CoA-transferase CaiB-like acyl-CoA transferase